MLNPWAPGRYGTWVDHTSFDPDIPGKWKGIKLFEIVFWIGGGHLGCLGRQASSLSLLTLFVEGWAL